MDTGEHIAIDTPFTEANQRYRQLQARLKDVTGALKVIARTTHGSYHKYVKGGWRECNQSICRQAQFIVQREEADAA